MDNETALAQFADATTVGKTTALATYCDSIDGIALGQYQYFRDAADVQSRTGKVIASQNGGACVSTTPSAPVCPPTQATCAAVAPPVATTPTCAAGFTYDATTSKCLAPCPSSLWAWTNGPRIPLAEADPTQKTPDGHEWCYYWGRGIAGGASDGGDPWAVAFDREVGKAVSYYPYYIEPDSTMRVQTYTDSLSNSTNFYNFTQTYAGLIPYYGAPSSYSTTLATIGGSKCAPPHPAGSTASTGYYQAWFPSDCYGHGDSSLSMSGNIPYGGWCVIDMNRNNLLRQRSGITRVQIGGALVIGAGLQSTTVDSAGYGTIYNGASPTSHGGCTPGWPALQLWDNSPCQSCGA